MLTLQWLDHPETLEPDQAQRWHTLQVRGIPLQRPVLIRFSLAQASMLERQRSLLRGLSRLLVRMASVRQLPAPKLARLQAPDAATQLLEVVLADGHTPVAMQPRWQRLLCAGERSWILPLLPARPLTAWQTLPEPLQKLNIAFWNGRELEDLALTVLARAGVSDLDRRVFISYRRADTEPMAQQLFDALSRRNVSVFLDTVSVEPAVDFQARLFEQLADHSMVVVLHSPTFSQSTWARQEVEYALAHRLSLLIVRLPGLAAGDVLQVSRRGDQLDLQVDDLRAPARARPAALKAAGLTRLVTTILQVHDVELIRRLEGIRRRSLMALRRHGLSVQPGLAGAAIHVQGAATGFSLLPTVRPPDVGDLHAASTGDPASHAPLRIVVGHAANLPAERRALMDWAVDGRNVQYCDVAMLDTLLRQINGSTP